MGAVGAPAGWGVGPGLTSLAAHSGRSAREPGGQGLRGVLHTRHLPVRPGRQRLLHNPVLRVRPVQPPHAARPRAQPCAQPRTRRRPALRQRPVPGAGPGPPRAPLGPPPVSPGEVLSRDCPSLPSRDGGLGTPGWQLPREVWPRSCGQPEPDSPVLSLPGGGAAPWAGGVGTGILTPPVSYPFCSVSLLFLVGTPEE